MDFVDNDIFRFRAKKLHLYAMLDPCGWSVGQQLRGRIQCCFRSEKFRTLLLCGFVWRYAVGLWIVGARRVLWCVIYVAAIECHEHTGRDCERWRERCSEMRE